MIIVPSLSKYSGSATVHINKIEHIVLPEHIGPRHTAVFTIFAVRSKRFYRRGFYVHEKQTCLNIVRHTQRFHRSLPFAVSE